jgi:hypothetical protein
MSDDCEPANPFSSPSDLAKQRRRQVLFVVIFSLAIGLAAVAAVPTSAHVVQTSSETTTTTAPCVWGPWTYVQSGMLQYVGNGTWSVQVTLTRTCTGGGQTRTETNTYTKTFKVPCPERLGADVEVIGATPDPNSPDKVTVEVRFQCIGENEEGTVTFEINAATDHH